MKRLLILITALTLAFFPALFACNLPAAVDASTYIGTADETPVPAIAALVTPTPTPVPRTLHYDMQETLFRRDGLFATVTGITYIEGRSVDVAVSIRNQSNLPLAFYARVPGALNGWAVTFEAEAFAAEGTFAVLPGAEETLRLTAPLDPGTAGQMNILDVQTLNLSFSGTFGEKGFAPATNTIVNPGCDAGYVQSYGETALLIHQSARTCYYYHALDPVTATLYLSMECPAEPCDLTAVARVNGYALGASGVHAGAMMAGKRLMLAIPLLDTLRAYAQNSVDTLVLSVFFAENGKEIGADTFAVPTGGDAAENWRDPGNDNELGAPADALETPAYLGSGRTFFNGGEIYFRYEGLETEPSDYYGTITRFRLVCINDTDDALYPRAERILLAGAVMEGGFVGYVPPRSVTNLDFYIFAHVSPGPEIGVSLEVFDAAAKLRRIVKEEITFLS